MKPFQVIVLSGGARWGTRSVGRTQRRVLASVGVRDGELVGVEFPFGRPVRPARRTSIVLSSAVNGLRYARSLLPLRAFRDRLLPLLGDAERTLVVARSQGLHLLERANVPDALLERLRVVALGPISPTLLRGGRPVPAADLVTVLGRRDAFAARTAPSLEAGVDADHLGYLDDPGVHRILRDAVRRTREEGERAAAHRAERAPRIVLAAPPFSGHLHPLLGVADALRVAGAQLVVCSTADRRSEIEAEGFAFEPLAPGREHEVWAMSEIDHRRGVKAVAMWRELRRNLRVARDIVPELEDVVRRFDADGIVADFTLPHAGVAAERTGRAWITTMPSPCAIECADGPPSYCGGLTPDATPRGRLRDAAFRLAVRVFKFVAHRLVADLARDEIPAVYRADGSERAYSPQRVLCLGERSFEFATRWPRAVRFTGPVRYTPSGALRRSGAPERLRREPGPLVVLSFGTHLAHVKRDLGTVLDRLRALVPEADVVVAAGRQDADAMHVPGADERLRIVPYLDYDGLDEADVVVHHGGAGITWAALASGRRQIVVPADHDQFDFAARLAYRGLAVRVDEPADVPAALRRLLDEPDPAAGERARWARRLSANDGAARAAAQVLLDVVGTERSADVVRAGREEGHRVATH